MKNYIVALAIGSVLSLSTIQAQDQGGRGPRMDPKEQATKMTDKMATDLTLTADQKTKVLAINTDAAQKMSDLRAKRGQAGVDMKAERKKIEDAKDTQLKAVLTDDQYKKYLQMKQEMEQKRMERRSQGGGQGGE